jgi:FKBP-type peptidyl-prolyl cis-trans isomerase SlyD
MTIDKDMVVSVNYFLAKKDSGEKIEETSTEKPFVFLYGSGSLLEDFETNLDKKKVGDTFDFFIEHKRGYGERDDRYLAEIPLDAFYGEDGKLDTESVKVGATLPMVDKEGEPLYGLVLEIGDENIKMDFNHPLAGIDLHFKGEVLEIRAATSEELEHGHVHGPGGHEH